MEGLTMSDAPPPPGGPGAQPFAQLPPQMFTTAAQLLDLTDSMPPSHNMYIRIYIHRLKGTGEKDVSFVLMGHLQKNSWWFCVMGGN